MIIQIYAFTSIEDAVQAANFGVNHIGFVAGKYDMVYGELDFKAAREMVEALPANAVSSALTMATEIDEIIRMAKAVKPDIIHISSDVHAVDVDSMRELKHKLPEHIRIMKAIPVSDESSLLLARQYAPVSDIFLLDSKVQGLPGVGATGKTHDWNISKKIIENSPIPVILAGGLTPKNVGDAMKFTSPWGVDSNTSTNVAGSFVDKDLKLIKDFVMAVQAQLSSDQGASL